MTKLINQIFKFGIVGIIAFLIDYGVLIFLTQCMGIYYLISALISFCVSTVFNYFASMRYVFKGKEDMSRQKEFIIFVVLSVIGLGLNELFMWIMVDKCSVYYMISKLFVTAIVMIWNFVTRKIFLEDKSKS